MLQTHKRPQIVVVNASPLIALSEIHQFELLRELYGELIVPPKVREEVLRGGPQGIGVEGIVKFSCLQTALPRNSNSLFADQKAIPHSEALRNESHASR